MSMKDARARGAQALAKVEANPGNKPLSPSGRPLTSPGAMAMMQPTIDALNDRTKAAEKEAVELRTRMENNPVELPFDQIVEVPGRRRRLTPQEFEELRQNLEHNPLVHPVVVRPLPGRKTADGRPLYEAISGYNRLAILRLLDRKVAPVRVLPVDDVEAEDAAFWSNLLQPSLPDYEKYIGLKQVQARHGLSQTQLAQRAGISKTLLSFLFSFESLPEQVLDILKDQPQILGANAARAMVAVSKAGGTERVLEAVRELAAGRISQDRAVAQAQQQGSTAATSGGGGQRTVTANTKQIRRGNIPYCRLVERGNSLRVEFKTEAHRAMAGEQVAQLLEHLARSLDEQSEQQDDDAPKPTPIKPKGAVSAGRL